MEFHLRSSLFDRDRKVVLTEDYVEYEANDLIGNEFIRFNKADIADIKFGITYSSFRTITYGREYAIAFKSKANKILTIKFASYFNLHKEYWDFYTQLVAGAQKHFISNLSRQYLEAFYSGQDVRLGSVGVMQEGIKKIGTNLNFLWSDLKFSEHKGYFVLSRKSAPEFHLWIVYNEWHTELLYVVIKTILRNKNLSQQQRPLRPNEFQICYREHLDLPLP